MSDVDDAIARSDGDWYNPRNYVERSSVTDLAIVVAEVKRLRGIHAKIAVHVERLRLLAAAMGIVDTEDIDDENLRTWRKDVEAMGLYVVERGPAESLFGIDPNFTEGQPVDEFLDESRGEA